MKEIQVQPIQSFQLTTQVPGDKSISHRSIMLGALAQGKTIVDGFLPGADCLHTLQCFQKLGVNITQTSETTLEILGAGLTGMKEPVEPLYVGNSGTTIRLILGILAGLPFFTTIYGDDSIARRPMKRVVDPLRKMGAQISGRSGGNLAPLAVQGTRLRGVDVLLPIASAQVKSALLFAGLHAEGITTIKEPMKSRDHTERMLQAFGVDVQTDGLTVSVKGNSLLTATNVRVPGDISSAAFLFAAAAMVPNSEIMVENVGLNPTRTGILDILEQMGAEVQRTQTDQWCNEPVGTVIVRSRPLQSVEISGEMIPRLIDEIPMIACIATQAKGTTVIRDATELKVKESNRITTTVAELRKLGAWIEETTDGMIIHGPTQLEGGVCDSHGDHRIGMAMAVTGLVAKEPVIVRNAQSFDVSFPGFTSLLTRLRER